MDFLLHGLPEQLSLAASFLLIVFAGLTSALTAAVGAGGGVLLLAVLALTLPTSAIIPVHGLVQFGSNFIRALMLFKHIQWQLFAVFVPGVMLGAYLASLFLIALPLNILQLSIAGFILFLTWGPKIPSLALGRLGTFFAGLLTSFLSMFVGATGPLVTAFVKQQHSQPIKIVANFSAFMSAQHLPKAIIFGAAGFVFKDWLLLIALMVLSGALGTWLGLKVMQRMSTDKFKLLINLVLTLLALRLIYAAFFVTG